MVSDELVAWTRDALTHVYNLAFLQRHVQAACLNGQFGHLDGGSALQQMLLQTIERLKPPETISPNAPALRLFSILRLRYLEGLTQAEVADELHVSLRHLKREQERAVEAVAALLLEGSERNQHITSDVGDLSEHAAFSTRGIAHKSVSKQEVVRVDELLRTAASVLDMVLQAQNLHLQVVLDTQLPLVRADPMIVRQLLISALGWTMRGISGQTLTVHLFSEDEDIVLRLHKPQAAETSMIEGELGTVQQLAEAIPAKAQIVTEPGSGNRETTLEIRMLAQEKRCVLMIDDDPDVIQLMQRYLQDSDEFYLVGTTQPEDALRQVISLRPACILLDLMMPGHDGWELLKLLRLSPESAMIPVVVSSVLREPDLARALGATDILPRPFTAEQLTQTLHMAIARNPA
ncbi:MAG: response regulator [Chloroflexi bacterium]|nr:response regulator [Chloroflexota bacterium]